MPLFLSLYPAHYLEIMLIWLTESGRNVTEGWVHSDLRSLFKSVQYDHLIEQNTDFNFRIKGTLQYLFIACYNLASSGFFGLLRASSGLFHVLSLHLEAHAVCAWTRSRAFRSKYKSV